LLILAQSFLPLESARAANAQPPAAGAHRLLALTQDQSTKDSDVLTRQILLKEIELEKFNLNYRIQTGKVDRWKSTRFFLLQQANVALLDAGFIATVAERSKHISSPHHINIVTLEHALIPRIIGPFIAAGSSVLELGLDGLHDYDLKKSGFSPTIAKDHVISLRSEIDRLLKERDAVVQREQSDPNSASARIVLAEGDVLKDSRDLSLAEFERFHIGARKFSAFEKSLQAINAGTMGILSAAEIIPLVAAHKRDASIDGPATVLAIIVGGLFMATPFAGRAIGKLAAARDRRFLSACSGDVIARDMSKLDADRDRLKQLCQTAGDSGPESGATVRLGVYESQSKNFRDRLEAASKELKAGRRIAIQNVIAGNLVGGTVIGAESAMAVGAFNYPTNARRFNVLADAGSIALVGGLSLFALDNCRIHAQAEWDRHKLSHKGQLPRQVLESRLKELDGIESALRQSPGTSVQ
jgi:hypothetical protein